MTSVSAHARPDDIESGFARTRRRFREWRRTRPFWAGVIMILSAGPILYFPYFHVTLGGLNLALSTTAGAGSLVIGILLIVLGLCVWFQQQVRVFCGVAAILLALVSFPVSNFGGFFLGLLLGIIAGSLAISWAPNKAPAAAEGAADGPAEEAPDPAATVIVPPEGSGRRRRPSGTAEYSADGSPDSAPVLPNTAGPGGEGAGESAPEQSYGPEFFFGAGGRRGTGASSRGGRHGL